jgi:integrase
VPKVTKIVWKNKDGAVSPAYQVRYKDRSGARRAKQFRKKRDAEEFANRISLEVQAGNHVHDRDTITVAEAAEDWLTACETGRDGKLPLERHSVRNYRSVIALHILPFLGGMKLSKLTPAHIRQLRDIDLLQGGRSRSMTARALKYLSSICNYAIVCEILGANPCRGITVEKSARHQEELKIPSKDQARRILERAAEWVQSPPRCHAHRNGVLVPVHARLSRNRCLMFYTMLRMLIGTGLRLGEARGAPRADLDLDKAMYFVRQRADEKNKIGPPKSAAGRRSIELAPGLVEDLRNWLAVASKSELIFGTSEGRPEGAQNLYKRYWLPLLVETGLARKVEENGRTRHEAEFSIHDLRHFHASVMIEAGIPIKELQVHMGHASIQITMDTYGHLFSDADAMARRRRLIASAEDNLLAPVKLIPSAQPKIST